MINIVIREQSVSFLKLFRSDRLKIHGTRGDINVFIRLLEPIRDRWDFTSNTNSSISRGTNVRSDSPLLYNIKVRPT